jgi:hypothetical protein
MALELKTDDDITTVSDADLVAGGDPETSYDIRHITPQKHREIVKQNTKKVPNRRSHAMEEVTDWVALQDALVDYAIAKWTGIVYKGQPLPCERENKLRLDAGRRMAILDRAGMNEVQAAPERRSESFPEGAEVC